MNFFLNHEFQITNEGSATLKEIKLSLKRIQALSSSFLQAVSHDGRLLVQFTMNERSMYFSSKHCN
jgi:hypothetical protein